MQSDYEIRTSPDRVHVCAGMIKIQAAQHGLTPQQEAEREAALLNTGCEVAVFYAVPAPAPTPVEKKDPVSWLSLI